eukprot:gene10656-13053_t
MAVGGNTKDQKRSSSPTKKDVKDEYFEANDRNWEIPDFTIKEIRSAIPSHCFQISTFKSFMWLFHDILAVSIIGYLATYIDYYFQDSPLISYPLWVFYWIIQGIVATGIWVLGHECGHQSFSNSKFINNAVGMFTHSFLLVPYYSWKISHSKHHKSTGHMANDQVYVPKTRSDVGLPKIEDDKERDGPHHELESAPLYILYDMAKVFIFGFPGYLLTNIGGQKYSGWTSHFNPNCAIFEKRDFLNVLKSIAGIVTMISLLCYMTSCFGSLAVIKYYLIPYLNVNFWLICITFLQHTDPKLPHYRDSVWNFQRGAALTVDRSYGWFINHFQHHISDTHVAHHFFSNMPHYNAQEATKHIKKVLGKHYFYDPTPIAKALWTSWTKCIFVEDHGQVVFYKN